MALLLGLVVAASFGSGDFLGGLASRRVGPIPVLAVVQMVAVVGAVVYALTFGGEPTGVDLGYGAAAGACNVVALGFLYAGLASGRMGIVAPVTAVVAACIPVAWGLATGDDLSGLALAGVVIAVASAGLVARERDEADGGTSRALLLAAGAGVLFGVSFVLYASTGNDSGAWPALGGRIASVVLVVGFLLVARRWPPRVPGVDRRAAIGAGVLDVTATALLLVAVREGLTAEVAPVAALGPAFTVIWAWVVLREPIGRLQLAGLVFALAGLAMIAAG
jgi:drug/metabolite transporter (DMT)-like permease